jgi:ribonucleoside-diphosphate reductase alpha chain
MVDTTEDINMSEEIRYVIKRDGEQEEISFDKITRRIRKLAGEKPRLTRINPIDVMYHVVQNLTANITTSELDEHAARDCAARASEEPQYNALASRIAISNIHKNTCKWDTFSVMVEDLEATMNSRCVAFVREHASALDDAIDYSCDKYFDYFAVKVLERSYLLRVGKKIVERPQYMWMRVAVQVSGFSLERALHVYGMLSQQLVTHATPTLFNSSMSGNQLSSCMLLTNCEDSIEGIFKSISQCAILGKNAAGIGISINNIRAQGSIIQSTQRPSRGTPSFLQVYDSVVRCVDQGGKRKMSLAAYMEVWHADIMLFIKMRRSDGGSVNRARDLFYAVWSNNLLYERALAGEMWSLFDPVEAPLLGQTWGDVFNTAYIAYEEAGLAREQIPAQKLFEELALSQMETGMPYHLNKDSCNAKANLQNVGHINCSNLCSEILIPSSADEIGVCTLASINLAKFVKPAVVDKHGKLSRKGSVDYEGLAAIAGDLCENLNVVIDEQHYPLIEAERSNKRHRPIGIGVQGLANVFMLLHMPYDSEDAGEVNFHIFEAIYWGAINRSVDLAIQDGSYETYVGSPASEGRLQMDMWMDEKYQPKFKYQRDWDETRARVQEHGLRNSQMIALMPTASTSLLFGNYESFEPANANLFARNTLNGSITVVNKHLIAVLSKMGIWNDKMKRRIMALGGSVQDIEEIPERVRSVYRTVYEYDMMDLMRMAADRGRFVCHTQSMNMYVSDPSISEITKLFMRGYRLGLKTLSYYTHTPPAAVTTRFSLRRSETQSAKKSEPDSKPEPDGEICTMEDGCMSCGS